MSPKGVKFIAAMCTYDKNSIDIYAVDEPNKTWLTLSQKTRGLKWDSNIRFEYMYVANIKYSRLYESKGCQIVGATLHSPGWQWQSLLHTIQSKCKIYFLSLTKRKQIYIFIALRHRQAGVAPPPPMQPTYGGYPAPPPQQYYPAPPPQQPMGAPGYYYPPPQPGFYQYQSAPPPAGFIIK